MTSFHWTGLEIGALAILGAALAAWFTSRILARRDEREAAASPRRRPGARFVAGVGWQVPVPASYVQEPLAPTTPIVLGGAEFAAWAAALVATASAVSDRAGEFLDKAALADDYADAHPMQERPEPPAAAPGEPWQSNLPDDAYPPHQRPRRTDNTITPSLVEPGAPENNLGGETL